MQNVLQKQFSRELASRKHYPTVFMFFPHDLVLKTPLLILPGVSVLRQRALSVTMLTGQLLAHYMGSVGPVTHDICITLPGVTAHGQEDRGE